MTERQFGLPVPEVTSTTAELMKKFAADPESAITPELRETIQKRWFRVVEKPLPDSFDENLVELS